jgi:hypothetical protein
LISLNKKIQIDPCKHHPVVYSINEAVVLAALALFERSDPPTPLSALWPGMALPAGTGAALLISIEAFFEN